MPEPGGELLRIDNAYVLTVEIVGYAKLSVEERLKLRARLNEIVEASTRFRVASAAGKLTRLPADEGITLVFVDYPDAAIECALEIATGLTAQGELKVRMGLHSGPVDRITAPNGESTATGAGIELAERVRDCGDPGHILLSKRIAYELAPSPRWNAHLFELGDFETADGDKIPVVNFYTEQIGNREVPAKIKQSRERAQARERRKRWFRRAAIAIATIVVPLGIALATVLIRRELGEIPGPNVPEKSVAVLPFEDVSPTRDQEYFCDGVAEEILGNLAKIEGLRVSARESAFSFKGGNAPVNEIGHRLDVATVLEGDLRREGNVIHINARLIDTRSGSELWTTKTDKEMQNIFVLEDEITKGVVRALRIRTARSPGAPTQSNTAAYDLYLQGLASSNKGAEVDLRKGIELFQRALDEDPKLGRAWTGIARNWFWLGDSHVKPLDAHRRVQAAAGKALALNERDAEAHCYAGEARRILDWDLQGEDAELRRALKIQPSLEIAHLLLGSLRGYVGDIQENLAQLKTAARLNPLSPLTATYLVNGYLDADRLDEALAEAKGIIDIDPGYVYFEPALALVYREQGKLKEALEIYQRLEQTRKQPTAGLAITHAQLGHKEDASRVLDQLIQRANTYYFPGDQIAAVYAALGENDEAFRWLNRAVDEHSPTIHRIGIAREFRPLHSDPRFAELLRRIGLDPAKITGAKK